MAEHAPSPQSLAAIASYGEALSAIDTDSFDVEEQIAAARTRHQLPCSEDDTVLLGLRLPETLLHHFGQCCVAKDENGIDQSLDAILQEARLLPACRAQADLLWSEALRGKTGQAEALRQTDGLCYLVDSGYFKTFHRLARLGVRARFEVLSELVDLLRRPLFPEQRRHCWHACLYLAAEACISHTRQSEKLIKQLSQDPPEHAAQFDLQRFEWRHTVLEEIDKVDKAERQFTYRLISQASKGARTTEPPSSTIQSLSHIPRQGAIRRFLACKAPEIADKINGTDSRDNWGCLFVFLGILVIWAYVAWT